MVTYMLLKENLHVELNSAPDNSIGMFRQFSEQTMQFWYSFLSTDLEESTKVIKCPANNYIFSLNYPLAGIDANASAKITIVGPSLTHIILLK